ncbi:hypothetical protein BHC43_08245 [Snodgrassella alvi]|nr:hypothetical protein BHC43_08245 [Snodgrassella alvi]
MPFTIPINTPRPFSQRINQAFPQADIFLIIKVKNVMQYYHPSKKRLLILISISLLLEGCSISDWYNGYYVERSSSISFDKKSDAYYNAESPQMKELRSKNQEYCLELSNKPENRVERIGFPNGVWNQPMYEQCMEKRKTPTYGVYVSEQVKKRDAERRVRGEIVL